MSDKHRACHSHSWNVVELSFTSDRAYDNPYTDVEISASFTSPEGTGYNVAGFWDGEATWKVRFAPPSAGLWRWSSAASDTTNRGLHGQGGAVEVAPYQGANPIYRHGFLGLGPNQRGLVHADGTPFFWLGDTVWSVSANATLDEWREYLDFRSRQGFNVAQINSLHQWDASEPASRSAFAIDGPAWDLRRPHPSYFRYLDQLVAAAANSGFFVAMVALWCNYVPGTNPDWHRMTRPAVFTTELAERYGTYLAARYGAFGTIWIVSGDTDWKNPIAIAVYDAAAGAIRCASPWRPLLTAHLHGGLSTPEDLNAKDWLDIHMFQSGHTSTSSQVALRCAADNRAYAPARPVLNGEPNYEQIRFFDAPRAAERFDVRHAVGAAFSAARTRESRMERMGCGRGTGAPTLTHTLRYTAGWPTGARRCSFLAPTISRA